MRTWVREPAISQALRIGIGQRLHVTYNQIIEKEIPERHRELLEKLEDRQRSSRSPTRERPAAGRKE
jgi:hypothetical protein